MKRLKEYKSDMIYLQKRIGELEDRMFKMELFFIIVKFIILAVLLSGAFLFVAGLAETAMTEWPQLVFGVCIFFGITVSAILVKGDV